MMNGYFMRNSNSRVEQAKAINIDISIDCIHYPIETVCVFVKEFMIQNRNISFQTSFDLEQQIIERLGGQTDRPVMLFLNNCKYTAT